MTKSLVNISLDVVTYDDGYWRTRQAEYREKFDKSHELRYTSLETKMEKMANQVHLKNGC